MSDMTELMARKDFLDVCMRIEGLCAELYHYYSKIYEDIPEASRLWKKTALEEESHRKQFELAVFLLNESEYEVSRNSLERAYSIKDRLLKFIDQIKIDKPDLPTAVSMAIEMEEDLADLHVHTALRFREESMLNLFKKLGETDRDHVAALQCYRINL